MQFKCSHAFVVIPDGVAQGVSAAAYEIAGGVYDLLHKPIQGAMEGGVMGAMHGTTEGALILNIGNILFVTSL